MTNTEQKWLKEIRDNTKQLERIAKRLDAIHRQLDRLDRKDEPQTIYYPQVDGITPSVIVKDEPQTCSVSGRPYTDCCNCEYFKCTADEPQIYGYMTAEQIADYRKMLDNAEHKVYGNVFENESQTIIGERFPSYIAKNNAQVLDGWQTNPRTLTTAVEDEP